VTIVDVSDHSNHSAEQLRTDECSLCGAQRGRDYKRFSWHLAREHTPSDLNLTTGGVHDAD